MMQAGTLFKASLTVVICAIASYITTKRRAPSNKKLLLCAGGFMLFPVFLIVLSISLRSARLFCNVDIPSYNSASSSTKTSILAYWLCFAAIVHLCALCDAVFFLFIVRQLKSLSVGLTSSLRNSEISTFINRLKWYPLAFFLGWLADSVSLLCILITGHDFINLRIIANACAGSTGLAVSLSYFYYQFKKSSMPESANANVSQQISLSSGNSARNRSHSEYDLNSDGSTDTDGCVLIDISNNAEEDAGMSLSSGNIRNSSHN